MSRLETTAFDKLYPIVEAENEYGGIDYTVYIYDYIEKPWYFTEMIDCLYNATEKDQVVLKINSGGGYARSAKSLIDSIKLTRANTIANCSGTVASAATMIALSCNELYVAPHTEFYAHNFSGGSTGKGHELETDMRFKMKNMKDFFKNVYEGFLTQKELKKLIKDKDYIFTTEEVMERWERVVKQRIAKIEQQKAEQQKAELDQMIEYLRENGYDVACSKEG